MQSLLTLVWFLALAPQSDGPPFYTLGDPAWRESPSSDGPPVWSPDGSEVVFQFTREMGFAQIYAIRPDGSGLRRITDGTYRAGHPHWGPDGRLAFVSDRDGEREIYTMLADGSDVQQLTRDGTPKAFPVHSPDGSLIVFVRSIDESSWRRDLCLLDLATEEQFTLHESRSGLGWVTWSPDGDWVYFYEILADGTNQVFRISVDGIELQQVTTDTSADNWCADLSPDGAHLSFVRAKRVDGNWGGNGDLMIANADGSGVRAVVAGPWHENSARFAPDGKRLAYMSVETGYYELHVIDVDGTNDRRLTFQPETELTALVRAQGVAAGLEHARSLSGTGPLASEHALRQLFEYLPAERSHELHALARLYAGWYPDSEHARRVVTSTDPDWAEVLEQEPDPEVVTDAEIRSRIRALGRPWRVRDRASGVELLLVPAGTYWRGAGPGDLYDRANERPRHEVELTRPFYLGRYEVSNAQMRRFRPEHDSGSFYRATSLTLNDEDMPAVDVGWNDARAFCERFGFRLPTEAEWEYAARAGVETRYPWGEDPADGAGWGNGFTADTRARIPDMDWDAFSWEDGFDASAPVGSFRANAWGFHDLFGNAWEWCQDAYTESAYIDCAQGARDPVVLEGDKRVLRGGGFGNAPRGSGTPYRFGMQPDERFDANGFRVARSL